MSRNFQHNRKGMSIVISTIIIVAITITMAIAVSFWAMGISNAFTRFEKLEITSIYVSDIPVNYQGRQNYLVYFQLKNTGTNTLTINNVFLDGKPWNAQVPPSRVQGGQIAYQQSLISMILQSGQTITTGRLYLPVSGMWNSGDYVAIEIETSAGRHYPYTVVLP